MPLSHVLIPINTGSYFTGRAVSKFPSGDDGYDSNARVNPTPIGVDFTGDSCQVPVYGFGHAAPSADSRIILCSESEGDDVNSYGTQSQYLSDSILPVKTLSRARSLQREGYPDHVYFKRGDVWVDERIGTVANGRSRSEPAYYGWYGSSGARPRFESDGSTSSSVVSFEWERENVKLDGLHFYNPKFDHTRAGFDEVNDPLDSNSTSVSAIGGCKSIWIEDCRFDHTNISLNGWQQPIRDVWITRSSLYNYYSLNPSSYPSNIYVANLENRLVINECIFDKAGWNTDVPGAEASHYRHNMYLQVDCAGHNIQITNNLITRGSGQGAMGRPGGVIDNNFLWANSFAVSMGYTEPAPTGAGSKCWRRNNVVLEPQNHTVRNCTQNGCSDAMWGISYAANVHYDCRNIGNIVAHCDQALDGNKMAFRIGSVSSFYPESVTPQIDQDNIYYKWDDSTQGVGPSYADPEKKFIDYVAQLGFASEEDFLAACRNRGVRQWDSDYTANEINNYFRSNFNRPAIVVNNGGFTDGNN